MRTHSQNAKKSGNLSLSDGLEILLLFDTSTPFLTIAEISKKLGYSQSKTYRLAKTFINYNFLRKEPGTKQYILGINTIRLGLLAQKNLKLSAIARPCMEELSELTRETVFLTAINRTKIVVLDKVESKEPIRYASVRVGKSLPLKNLLPIGTHQKKKPKLSTSFLRSMINLQRRNLEFLQIMLKKII